MSESQPPHEPIEEMEVEMPIVASKPPPPSTRRWLSSICVIAIIIVIFQIAITALAVTVYQGQTVPVYPLENISFLKDRIRTFHSSGNYETTVQGLVDTWSAHFSGVNPAQNSIIVFDIDDTVLANYPEILDSDFGYIPKFWSEWVLSANASAIPQTREFFQHVRDRGFSVVFITGRGEVWRNATILNLELQSLTGYSQLIMRQSYEGALTAAVYKNNARRRVVAQTGGTIVGCIGDQLSDCAGENLGYVMKVPNYMYYLP